ncbi:MAG: M48 family metallopeptidase [Elusimicrobia bacterium]|nr:M48 family metallopeptidase [Elusimicrobiota bacterium]
MPEILHQDKKIEYSLKFRAWKRRLTLRINQEGEVAVSAPKSARQKDIEAFVLKHADWIFRQTDFFRNRLAEHPPREFVSGESFPVLGKNYRFQFAISEAVKRNFCGIEDGCLRMVLPAGKQNDLKEAARRALMDFYKGLAAQKIQEHMQQYAPILGVTPAKCRVGNQKSRWGSCSGKGNLRFNWRLAMTPAPVLEYVVVHELCHLKHPNHSDRFWRMVQSVLPDYKSRRVWLRLNSLALFRMI